MSQDQVSEHNSKDLGATPDSASMPPAPPAREQPEDAALRRRLIDALAGTTFGFHSSQLEAIWPIIAEAKAAIHAQEAQAIQNPWDYVQPCEPDCTPERHAYHQGQWDMAQRMSGSNFPTQPPAATNQGDYTDEELEYLRFALSHGMRVQPKEIKYLPFDAAEEPPAADTTKQEGE